MRNADPVVVSILVAALGGALLAPPPSMATLVDNGDGTITQTRGDGTRLMWLQDANHAATSGYPAYVTVNQYCPTPNPLSCYAISPQVGMSHAEALIWADTLDFAGHTDWRMASGLNPNGSGPFIGAYSQGGSGEMVDLTVTEGVWRDAPGPFWNLKLSYWTALSGPDFDDGIWDHLFLTSSMAILQSKVVVVGPDAFVDRRFAAWAVRDLPPAEPAAVPTLSQASLIALVGLLVTTTLAIFRRRSRVRATTA